MKNKGARTHKIKELVGGGRIDSQGKLLSLLHECGFDLTQATLSRDLKHMRIAKVGDGEGGYIYTLPNTSTLLQHSEQRAFSAGHLSATGGFLKIDFSGQMCVIKTRPGYAGGIALDIDILDSPLVMGTIAGDDTILVILRENVSRKAIIDVFKNIIPTIENKTE